MQDNHLDNTQPQSASHLSDTQPVRVKSSMPANPSPEAAPSAGSGKTPDRRRRSALPLWFLALLAILLLAAAITLGAIAGYLSGSQEKQSAAVVQAEQALQEQYQLGLQDLAEGRYVVARQRFEYILSQNPGYPDAADKLADAMSILYATSTPTAPPPTLIPTPTFDARPIQDLFAHAVTLLNSSSWTEVIDTIASLRKADLSYQSARVDGLLYEAFRNRGAEKIIQEGNLQGGVFDLSLAERFGPLDVEANSYRTWARIYMIGTSFWEAYPEQAVYFFSQVAAAAPGLHDSSGWSAVERYRGALIQYGDQLAKQGDWCEAQAQYELAMRIRADEALMQALTAAQEKCSPPTAVFTLTPTFTLPFTATATLSPTSTSIVLPTETPTPTFTVPVPVDTPTPTPSETPVPPTFTPVPTETTPPTP